MRIMRASRVIRDAQRERVLDRLADDAEHLVDHDVEGRRAAGHRLLKEMHEVLTKAVEFAPNVYSSSILRDRGLVVGDAVVVRVLNRGDIRAFTAGLLGDELPEPALRFNARARTWEHRDHVTASPIEAILDVIQPVVLDVARQRRGKGWVPPVAPPPGVYRVSQYRRNAGTTPQSAPQHEGKEVKSK
jgi:hypothetical protein